jgi:Secretion system C-terminal sorting domain
MRHIYLRLFTVTFLFLSLIFLQAKSYAQCPSGDPQGTTAFDTTIATPEGVNSMQLKFPQFDPINGMVTCVKLCVTITGVVDSVSVENNSTSPQTANVYYNRTDQITGPGLSTPLSNSVNYHYGPYSLGATDGFIGSGPDFISISHDTVLNAVQICRTISDSATIVQFYGTDSVAYTYDISAFTSITCTGGNYNSSISTSAFANFRFEYCTCPATILPLNINEFTVTKLSENKAELKWTGFDDDYGNYYYEVEISTDGHSFSGIKSFPKNTISNDPYKMLYTVPNGVNGTFYFRIKQVYSNGYVRYSNIKQAMLGSSVPIKFSIYPNPSVGIVGIKFDNISTGHFDISIYNAQGQEVVKKELVVSESSYLQVATLKSGSYWLRLTDKKSQASCVNQLLIK